MAEEAAPITPNAELLEWPKKDNRRFLHVVYRVGDLDRTIKFYTEGFGMKLLRRRDVPEEKYSNAFLGFGPEESNFVVELTYNYGVTSYDIGDGFRHFSIGTPDVYKMVEKIRALGGTVTGEPAPVIGGTAIIAFVQDPDGYTFKILERASTPKPLCQVMLHVSDLDRSIKFYEKALGMKLQRKFDRPEHKHSLAMIGYGDEFETNVLELTYNYGVTEYSKGNGYAQAILVAISTNDVYKSGEVVKLVTQELGGKITRQPGPLPGINTKITSFLDPDGWKTSNSFHLKMAEAAPVAPNAELLEWPKKDKRRLLHAVYRVGDLDRTIKFYTEGFGMKLLRKRDIPEEKYSNAFLAFGPEESNFAVELTYSMVFYVFLVT
ncbi:hypothetical protein JRO89_XS06G0167500 [Xanthoceras sorbifolium]|uniref:lactoylglutathione lyase n=1 Tax=Xanthoceras sorbifolium TaxID=99658 RepID=A0ABQ8HYP7_9ROSI|nr:hypothetical protein JRO89_XS06G0167500 [Xanthoceras sorbifolium]